MRESREAKRARARKIVAALERAYPDAKIALEFSTPLELLVATILSAQCTDERVNIVTKSLFKKYRSGKDYAAAPQEELEKDIQSTGFYRNKAKSLRNMAVALLDRHGGKSTPNMEALTHPACCGG